MKHATKTTTRATSQPKSRARERARKSDTAAPPSTVRPRDHFDEWADSYRARVEAMGTRSRARDEFVAAERAVWRGPLTLDDGKRVPSLGSLVVRSLGGGWGLDERAPTSSDLSRALLERTESELVLLRRGLRSDDDTNDVPHFLMAAVHQLTERIIAGRQILERLEQVESANARDLACSGGAR